ncbi:hypothetical protein L7F22_025719, partial [Adiantum nelumboides]|nr:hypothetical protein [Adiantum nelumboides]
MKAALPWRAPAIAAFCWPPLRPLRADLCLLAGATALGAAARGHGAHIVHKADRPCAPRGAQ